MKKISRSAQSFRRYKRSSSVKNRARPDKIAREFCVTSRFSTSTTFEEIPTILENRSKSIFSEQISYNCSTSPIFHHSRVFSTRLFKLKNIKITKLMVSLISLLNFTEILNAYISETAARISKIISPSFSVSRYLPSDSIIRLRWNPTLNFTH